MPIKLWLLVPVKPFGEGKSRLTQVLAAEKRAALNQAMLMHVLTCAQAAGVLSGMIVVSRDRAVLAQASQLGAASLREKGHDLNQALTQARQEVVPRGADAILVLPADLPLLTADDVRQLAALGQRQAGIVIAPSPDGGTNALLLRPPGSIKFSFGAASFHRHRQAAQTAGIPMQIYESPTLALDVDWPEDLAAMYATQTNSRQ